MDIRSFLILRNTAETDHTILGTKCLRSELQRFIATETTMVIMHRIPGGRTVIGNIHGKVWNNLISPARVPRIFFSDSDFENYKNSKRCIFIFLSNCLLLLLLLFWKKLLDSSKLFLNPWSMVEVVLTVAGQKVSSFFIYHR